MDWNITCDNSLINSDKRGIEVIWDDGKVAISFENIKSVKTEEKKRLSEKYKTAYICTVVATVSFMSFAYANIVSPLPFFYMGLVYSASGLLVLFAAYQVYSASGVYVNTTALTINCGTTGGSVVVTNRDGYPNDFITMISGRADNGMLEN